MKRFISIMALGLAAASASADVLDKEPGRFILKQDVRTAEPIDDVWARLIQPATWWHPDHTYSGDAANLSLDVQAGGLWREDWDGGSVAHGEVLSVINGRQIRLRAPFGPLQSIASETIWTITLTPDGEGTRIVFDEVAYGHGVGDLAEAVDFVKTEAIARLSATSPTK